jgi:hypothetical protein
MQMLDERLKAFPTLSISLDLEGRLGGAHPHVALTQVCVDAVDDEHPALIYVFDTHYYGNAVFGPGSLLRALLENPDIVKVMHCCQGDASSLQIEHSLGLRGLFDTGIADFLARSLIPNSKRGLKVVLESVLGEGAVHMPHKDEMEHFAASYGLTHAQLWSHRPLPYTAFEYAYQTSLIDAGDKPFNSVKDV